MLPQVSRPSTDFLSVVPKISSFLQADALTISPISQPQNSKPLVSQVLPYSDKFKFLYQSPYTDSYIKELLSLILVLNIFLAESREMQTISQRRNLSKVLKAKQEFIRQTSYRNHSCIREERGHWMQINCSESMKEQKICMSKCSQNCPSLQPLRQMMHFPAQFQLFTQIPRSGPALGSKVGRQRSAWGLRNPTHRRLI